MIATARRSLSVCALGAAAALVLLPGAPVPGPTPAVAAAESGATGAPTIPELAAEAGAFDTLLAAVKAAGLADALAGDGPFTVFAPTDDAFAKLPRGTVQGLLRPESKDALVAILSRHVVPGAALDAGTLASRRAVRTLDGSRVDVALEGAGLAIGGARVVGADLRASNGIVHVIDEVILPPSSSLLETAASAGAFTSLVAAVEAAGLTELLGGPGPYTVLAPTDDAFGALGSDLVSTLLRPENREALAGVLALHVIDGRAYASDVIGGTRATALSGGTLAFALEEGRLTVNGANVVKADVDTANGVIHVIDSVLVPEGFEAPATGRLLIGIQSGRLDRHAAERLGLDRDGAITVEGLLSDSGARDAGLVRGDVIIAVNGRPATSETLGAAKDAAGDGGTVTLRIVREVTVQVRRERDH